MSIYVEIRVRGRMEDLWQRTQDPALHERWDVRFSRIEYLPRHGDEPQRFRYETRIGFGLRIRGEGESTGTREGPRGERASALSFWSNDGKSLIRDGSGYWRYIPTDDGIRFLTWYDYEVRFGAIGRLVNGWIFRPLMEWATAWSFDRLRLWIEKGIDPEYSMQQWLVHAVARLALAIVFFYQGLVPKLIAHHSSELAMITDAGIGADMASKILTVIGLVEVALGAVILIAWKTRWPLGAVLLLMPATLVALAVSSPRVLSAAFNPVSLNVAVAALAAIAWVTSTDLPSASRCLRAKPAEAS